MQEIHAALLLSLWIGRTHMQSCSGAGKANSRPLPGDATTYAVMFKQGRCVSAPIATSLLVAQQRRHRERQGFLEGDA